MFSTEKILSHLNIPDFLLRRLIRIELADRLKKERKKATAPLKKKFIQSMNESPVFLSTDTANDQHYEVPTEFFLKVMGKHLKYSCGFWSPEKKETLDESEENMLRKTCENAELSDGMRILELGCGWGSLSLYMAEKFPKSKITSVSNSSTQKLYIDEQAQKRGLKNLEIVTQNAGEFETDAGSCDRVVSVEMFEHARNYRTLLEKISRWLRPEGKLFVHIFVHKNLLYSFDEDESWMAKNFFKDGLMPEFEIFSHFQEHLKVQRKWKINGENYHRTCEAWYQNHKAHKSEVMQIFENTYGKGQGFKHWNFWKVFFLACSELFRMNGGNEWFVGHYLLTKNS